MSDHAEAFSIFLLQKAKGIFGVKGRKPRQPWISTKLWVWTFCEDEVLLCSMGGDETLRGTLQGMESVWNAPSVGTESRSILLPCLSALWAQADRLKRKVKPALNADKLVFLEWNAKEAQRLASNGDSSRHVLHYASTGRENTKRSRLVNLQETRYPDQR